MQGRLDRWLHLACESVSTRYEDQHTNEVGRKNIDSACHLERCTTQWRVDLRGLIVILVTLNIELVFSFTLIICR